MINGEKFVDQLNGNSKEQPLEGELTHVVDQVNGKQPLDPEQVLKQGQALVDENGTVKMALEYQEEVGEPVEGDASEIQPEDDKK